MTLINCPNCDDPMTLGTECIHCGYEDASTYSPETDDAQASRQDLTEGHDSEAPDHSEPDPDFQC